MDLLAISATLGGFYITGFLFGYGFLAVRRLFETAT